MTRHRVPVVVVALAAVCLLTPLLGEPGRLLLRFDRTGLESWQLWRLLTAHLVHLNWGHALMNIAALALIGEIFRREMSEADWAVAILVSALGVSVGLYVASAVEWYVGLSGVLHGVLVYGSIEMIRRGVRLGWVILVVVAGKVVFEQTAGPVPYTAALAGGPVVVEAHLYGAIAGVFAIALKRLVERLISDNRTLQ